MNRKIRCLFACQNQFLLLLFCQKLKPHVCTCKQVLSTEMLCAHMQAKNQIFVVKCRAKITFACTWMILHAIELNCWRFHSIDCVHSFVCVKMHDGSKPSTVFLFGIKKRTQLCVHDKNLNKKRFLFFLLNPLSFFVILSSFHTWKLEFFM